MIIENMFNIQMMPDNYNYVKYNYLVTNIFWIYILICMCIVHLTKLCSVPVDFWVAMVKANIFSIEINNFSGILYIIF